MDTSTGKIKIITPHTHSGIRVVLAHTLLLFVLSACTRSSVPIDVTATHAIQLIEETAVIPTAEIRSIFQPSETYAVVWIPDDDTLKLRVPAGIAGSVVDELDYNTGGVRVTGNTTSLGSSLWVEIEGPDGERGWVNSWNLTEDTAGIDFCTDIRILGLLEKATQALIADEIDDLVQVVNPKRGLILRHDWWNPEVMIRSSELATLYLSRVDREWGMLSGGDFAIQGSFSEIFSPLLKDVLTSTPIAVCEEIPGGMTSMPVTWPGEYANMHFYAFHRPSPEGGNRFDWRTFVFGFEYLQGVPYLTLIVHFHGDI